MHANVHTVLKDKQIPYLEIKHSSFDAPINSPMDFASALGYEISRITKSVFLRSKSKEKYIMAVCSIDKKLDMAKIALLVNANKIEVANKDELADLVGYPPNGVCSIGLPSNIEIFIDKSLSSFQTVLIGSGEAGVEIEISPKDLFICCNTNLENIILT